MAMSRYTILQNTYDLAKMAYDQAVRQDDPKAPAFLVWREHTRARLDAFHTHDSLRFFDINYEGGWVDEPHELVDPISGRGLYD